MADSNPETQTPDPTPGEAESAPQARIDAVGDAVGDTARKATRQAHDLADAAWTQARAQQQAITSYAHEHPFMVAGAALAAGLLIGSLMRR